jgi:hypothetical protein
MQSLSVTGELQIQLHGLRAPAQLCDDTGRVLGYFTPAGPAVYQGIDSPTDVEELRRRQAAGGGRPLKDILAELESRP